MLKKLLLLVGMLIVFSGCATPTPEYVEIEAIQATATPILFPELNINYIHVVKIGDDTVVRFVDVEANSVCWVYEKTVKHNGYEEYGLGVGGGISCLPLSETALEY